MARTRPGKLLQHGLQTMGRYLSERGQADRPEGERQALHPRVVRYLTTVATAARSQPLGFRNERELRTLAEGLDLLMEGKLAELGDLLMQRYKAVETASSDASWDIARHYELIPDTSVSTVSFSERAAATAMRQRELKLEKLAVESRALRVAAQ